MGKGTLARMRNIQAVFYHTQRRKVLLAKIQRCVQCGSKAASIIFVKTDLERKAIIHCHKCGYHDEIKETKILSSGKRSPALEIPDFANRSWDSYRAQLSATA